VRTLTYLVACTLDGFIAAPDREDPTQREGFFLMEGDHGEALLRDWPEIIPTHVRPALGMADTPNKHFDTVLEGRVSYEGGVKAGVNDAYEHLRHLVFSRTLTEVPGEKIELVNTDPVARVRELKQEEGAKIWLVGGATLAGALRDEIDELVLKLHPVIAGSGVPLLEGEFHPRRFTLTDVERFDSGVLHLTYVRP